MQFYSYPKCWAKSHNICFVNMSYCRQSMIQLQWNNKPQFSVLILESLEGKKSSSTIFFSDKFLNIIESSCIRK